MAELRTASGGDLRGGRALLQIAATGVALSIAYNVTGAFVRLSLAGIGCEGWPDCAAGHDPEGWAFDAVRFGHRIVAILTAMVALVALAIGFIGRERPNQVLGLLIAMLAIWVVLGSGAASERGAALAPLLGDLLGGVVLAALFAALWERNRGAPPLAVSSEGLIMFAALALAAVGAQVSLGALTSVTQAAADCATGECKDQALGLILSVHGIFAGPAAMLVLAAGAALWWKARARLFGALLAALAVMQVALGSSMGAFDMPLALVVLHNALANLLLVALAAALTALVRAKSTPQR